MRDEQHSVSRILSDNTPEYVGSLMDKGSKYYQKMFGNNQVKKQMVFMQLLRHLSYMFDPWREESLAKICLKCDKVWHRIPLDLVLTQSSIALIMSG